jgi:hypothetical protein
MKLKNLKKGEYFQVGRFSNRRTFRIIRMTLTKIYLLNESFKTNCHKIDDLDDLYTYEEYNFQKIDQQEGQDLFLSLIDKKILTKKALIVELKKTKDVHKTHVIKRNQLELRKFKFSEKKLKNSLI